MNTFCWKSVDSVIKSIAEKYAKDEFGARGVVTFNRIDFYPYFGDKPTMGEHISFDEYINL